MSATVAILWLLIPIEVSRIKAGARKVSLSSTKPVSIEIEPPMGRKLQGEEFSLSMC
jgi:hypothetical protein